MTRRFRHAVLAAAVALAAHAPAAFAFEARDASGHSVIASWVSVFVASKAVMRGGAFVVDSVSHAGTVSRLALRGASDGVAASAEVSRRAFEAAGVAVGSTVEAVAESTGLALYASGRLLAFVPNEAAQSMVFHARHAGGQR